MIDIKKVFQALRMGNMRDIFLIEKMVLEKYKEKVNECKSVFLTKFDKYGVSWQHFREKSLTDQLYIKVQRLRNIDEGIKPLVEGESLKELLMSIFNYSIIKLISLRHTKNYVSSYNTLLLDCQELYKKKNNDYGNIWESLHLETLVDFIVVKLHRLRNMEMEGRNEKIYDELYDIANYSIFLLIRNENND